jgi:hypothetical protein
MPPINPERDSRRISYLKTAAYVGIIATVGFPLGNMILEVHPEIPLAAFSAKDIAIAEAVSLLVASACTTAVAVEDYRERNRLRNNTRQQG